MTYNYVAIIFVIHVYITIKFENKRKFTVTT